MKEKILNSVGKRITNLIETEQLCRGLGVFLFGKIISPYTKSPAMWNEVFRKYNIPAHYQALDIPTPENVEEILVLLSKDESFIGNNVGSPYKGIVSDLLQKNGSLDAFAQKIGVVNTVVHENGFLVGYNTDGRGEIENLKSVIPDFFELSVLVLGAGGGAKGVIAALLEKQVKKVTIANRNRNHADILAEELGTFYDNTVNVIEEKKAPEYAASGEYGLILNASLKGQATQGTAQFSALAPANDLIDNIILSKKALRKLAGKNLHAICADLVYNPSETPFLKLAKEEGLVTNNGMMMLVHQAALAFQLMFQKKIVIDYNRVVDIMKKAFISV